MITRHSDNDCMPSDDERHLARNGWILRSAVMELVPIKEPWKVWDIAKPHIQKVLDKAEEDDIGLIYQELINNDRQLWMVLKDGEAVASVLTMIQEYHGKRTGYLTHAGGKDARDWFHIVNPIGDYFKAEGCTTFRIVGRRGWMKYLPEFRTDKVIMEKSLDG